MTLSNVLDVRKIKATMVVLPVVPGEWPARSHIGAYNIPCQAMECTMKE